MDVLLLDEAAVRCLIDPLELLDELADGFRLLSAGDVVAPTRIEVALDRGFSLAMPAYRLGGHIGVKIVNVFEGNESRGLPSHLALIALFDAQTGVCVALMDGTQITALRTAGAAVVSARLLAREDARVLTIVGAGVQGRTHLDLLPLARDIDEIRVSSLRFDDAERLAERDPRAVATPIGDLEAAVRSSAIVCLCTHSGEAVVDAEWIGAGTHVTSVGYREPRGELPRDLLERGRLLAAARTSGWRIPAISASIAAGAWAISCLLAPTSEAGSEGHAWAWATLVWAVVTLAAAAWPRTRDQTITAEAQLQAT